MNIVTNELTGKSSESLTTEIMFFVASAKALGEDLIRLNIKKYFDEERETKRIVSVSRILRAIKRQGLIQLFIFSNEMNNSSTEVEYLKNKYPSMDKIDTNEEFFILKL